MSSEIDNNLSSSGNNLSSSVILKEEFDEGFEPTSDGKWKLLNIHFSKKSFHLVSVRWNQNLWMKHGCFMNENCLPIWYEKNR